MFTVFGTEGCLEIKLFPKKKDSSGVRVDAYGNKLIDTPFDDFGFGYDLLEDLELGELEDDIEMMEAIEDDAEETLMNWFADCVSKAGGHAFPLDCYWVFHDDDEAYHLQRRVFVQCPFT
jgi:hypothetical protein